MTRYPQLVIISPEIILILQNMLIYALLMTHGHRFAKNKWQHRRSQWCLKAFPWLTKEVLFNGRLSSKLLWAWLMSPGLRTRVGGGCLAGRRIQFTKHVVGIARSSLRNYVSQFLNFHSAQRPIVTNRINLIDATQGNAHTTHSTNIMWRSESIALKSAYKGRATPQ